MKKDEFIKRYNEEAYEKKKAYRRAWYLAHLEEVRAHSKAWAEAHPDEMLAYNRVWREAHPEKVKEKNHEADRKDGKRYEKKLESLRTGLQGERHRVRVKHGRLYRPCKNIIAPDSQLHHSWRPGTSEYTGLALVEADAHMHGFIDVIQIFEGEIELFTEAEIREQ